MAQQTKLLKNIGQETSEFTRTFSNPICKDTYNSLPKIYGKKKKGLKNNIILANITKKNTDASFSRHYFSANQERDESISKKRKATSVSKHLSQPKTTCHCIKINCACHGINDQLKTKQKIIYRKRKIQLPQIRKFDLEDLQSYHKVSRNQILGSKNHVSGLQNIIEEQQDLIASKLNENKQLPSPSHKSHHHKINSSQTKYNKRSFKPLFNTKFQIEEQESQEQKNTEDLLKKSQGNQNKDRGIKGAKSPRFVTEVNDSDTSNKQSVSLSSFIFRTSRRATTNYHDLNKSEKSIEDKLRRSRTKSTQSNGLFKIPEQPEYKQYLKDHRKLGPDFNINKLIKSPHFRILKSEKSVYFGEVNTHQEKDGEGLSVSQKQIFEGSYKNNTKVNGYERNIDGVYYGSFVNGLRSGHGTFKWNNGQIFQGNWQAGMKNGHGTWKSPKGDYYEGGWKNNRQHGIGVFRHKMSTYKGQFSNFLKNGQGEQIFVNGDKYSGEYKDGKPHGNGRYNWHQGGYYQGQFNHGYREGQGKWVDEHGTIYQGQFKQDSKHGYGKQTFKSGQIFEGQFFQGTRASGKIFDKQGRCIDIKNS